MELKETEEEKDKRGSEKDMASLRRRLQQKLMEEIESRKSVSDEELWELIDRAVLEAGQAEYIPLKEKKDLRVRLFDSFRRLGILQELIDDRQVTEIMVNGHEKVFIERGGRTML